MDIKKRIQMIPNSPGVYLFFNTKKKLIYVGKATSLRNRVRSYFANTKMQITKSKRPIETLIAEVSEIKWEETDSVLEAVILEANYIKKYLPKYNVIGKDNKSWNYIVITNDKYPKVQTIRQHDLKNHKLQITNYKLFGPYPGLNTKATMKLLQRLFYISNCKPAVSHERNMISPLEFTPHLLRGGNDNTVRPCLYYQMGQCLGVCTGEISPAEYKKKVIRPLVTFLQGGKKRLIVTLEKAMLIEAKTQNFEEAARLRNQIRGLKRIHDIALLNDSFFDDKKMISDQGLMIKRIEGYDISNLGVSGKVGSMVVFTNGEADKKQYRKFKIKTVVGQSDVDCLAEVLERRLRHQEWTLPDLFLIDGGKPQVNRVCNVLKLKGIEIPVVGIAKGPERKKNEFVLRGKGKGERGNREFIKWVDENKSLLIRVRDEAHRFAIAYQRKLR